jgi:sugar phosphate isomerase/epimerase
VHTLNEVDELRVLTGSSQVALMADVFHMNIEEDSLTSPLRAHAGQLRHVHLADNQRRAPGTGSLDLAAVLGALDDVGYAGALALEFLPATDAALRRSLDHLHTLGSAPEIAMPC